MKIHSLITKIFASITLALGLGFSTMLSAAEFSKAEVQALHGIIYHYIVNHPQILIAASEKLREQAIRKQQFVAVKAMAQKQNTQNLFHNPHSPVAGNPKGRVMVVEFFDYRCPHCKDMESIVEDLLEHNSDIGIIYKELPIFGGVSEFAAKAALASMKQKGYLKFHRALMNASQDLTEKKVIDIAKKQGLNIKQLKKEMKAPQIAKSIQSNFALARALQLIGTPAFIISNEANTRFQFIPGQTSEDELKQAIAKVSR